MAFHKAGASICVLEALDCIGGKTWTAQIDAGGCVELGAAWINDTNQHRMYSYARQFGLKLITQNVDGDGVMHDLKGDVHRFKYGESPKFSEAEVEDLERVRDLMHDLSLKSQMGHTDMAVLDAITVEEFVNEQQACLRTRNMINLWTQVMIGVCSDEISAASFIDYCGKGGGLTRMRSDKNHGGQYLRFRNGTQSVAQNILNLLLSGSVQLYSSVMSVENKGSYVVAQSTTGMSFYGRKLILSIPTSLYHDISFSPTLKGDKLIASTSTKLGFYTKVIAIYNKPWWTDQDICGLGLSYHGPVVVARDTSSPANGRYSITCFVNGSIGREWSKLSGFKRRINVLQHIAKVYGNSDEAMKPIKVLEQQWTKEQWSKGAVCPMSAPGFLSKVGHAWPVPVGNIHFVETELAREWKGYMEGAACSGEDGAKEVFESLDKLSAKEIKARL